MILNLFREAYQNQRKTGKLYKGFGLWHKDDVSEYFVHDNNEGYSKRTYISQSIGESVLFFSENMLNEQNGFSPYIKCADSNTDFCIYNISLPDDWIYNEIFTENVYLYKVRYYDYEKKFDLNAVGKDGIKNDFKVTYYDYLPLFVSLLYYDYEKSEEIRYLSDKFVLNRNIKNFAVLCETFYQMHKYENYDITCNMIEDKYDYRNI